MGFFEKLKEGLKKTKEAVFKQVTSLFSRYTVIDDDLYEELEEILITSDVGVGTTEQILEELQEAVRREKITDPEEARKAEADGADYLGCGAVFGTGTKAGVAKLGLERLQNIRQAVTLPMVGIGGVKADNYAEVLATGADGAAIISGILAADDISAEVAKFVQVRSSFR